MFSVLTPNFVAGVPPFFDYGFVHVRVDYLYVYTLFIYLLPLCDPIMYNLTTKQNWRSRKNSLTFDKN